MLKVLSAMILNRNLTDRPESISNLFDTQMVFLKEFLEKVESEKYQ